MLLLTVLKKGISIFDFNVWFFGSFHSISVKEMNPIKILLNVFLLYLYTELLAFIVQKVLLFIISICFSHLILFCVFYSFAILSCFCSSLFNTYYSIYMPL